MKSDLIKLEQKSLQMINLGIVMFLSPASGALALIWVIGAYAILFGALMPYLGFKLRNVDQGATWQRA